MLANFRRRKLLEDAATQLQVFQNTWLLHEKLKYIEVDVETTHVDSRQWEFHMILRRCFGISRILLQDVRHCLLVSLD